LRRATSKPLIIICERSDPAHPAIDISMHRLVPMAQIVSIMRKDWMPALFARRINIRRVSASSACAPPHG
jgi:hypothetical protein